LRFSPETVLELCNTPGYLSAFIPFRSQWQDCMVIRLGEGIAHPVGEHVGLILGNDLPAGLAIVGCNPFEERWPQVKANALKVP
jgi:hypothetical protein